MNPIAKQVHTQLTNVMGRIILFRMQPKFINKWRADRQARWDEMLIDAISSEYDAGELDRITATALRECNLANKEALDELVLSIGVQAVYTDDEALDKILKAHIKKRKDVVEYIHILVAKRIGWKLKKPN